MIARFLLPLLSVALPTHAQTASHKPDVTYRSIEDLKPNYPPSYSLHVTPSQDIAHGTHGNDSYRVLEGYTLKTALSTVFGVERSRISLPSSLDDDKLYDLSLVLPSPENWAAMSIRFQQGIEDYFHLTLHRDERQTNAYVVTFDPNRQLPPRHTGTPTMLITGDTPILNNSFQMGGTNELVNGIRPPFDINSIGNLVIDGPVDDVCRQIDIYISQPVLNETNLQGQFEFRVGIAGSNKHDFLQRLRNQTGLIITPSQRVVETLVFEPR